MAAPTEPACARCGAALPPGAPGCPACGGPVDGSAAGPAPTTEGRSGELGRRIHRLQQWSASARALDVRLPTLPSWAEASARHGTGGDAWLEVVRGVERLAQRRVVAALETWERAARHRLARLEAYSVDGRLERDQIDDVLREARQGEITQALTSYQQVDRVVALKERHLDQAREELEGLVSLLRDMLALGLEAPADPDTASEELERELRGGRLAALKQRLRDLRAQAVTRLKAAIPTYVAEYGDHLVRERADGVPVEAEAHELAQAARAFARGHPEETLRRMRALQRAHGAGFARAAARSADGGAATGSSREA